MRHSATPSPASTQVRKRLAPGRPGTAISSTATTTVRRSRDRGVSVTRRRSRSIRSTSLAGTSTVRRQNSPVRTASMDGSTEDPDRRVPRTVPIRPSSPHTAYPAHSPSPALSDPCKARSFTVNGSTRPSKHSGRRPRVDAQTDRALEPEPPVDPGLEPTPPAYHRQQPPRPAPPQANNRRHDTSCAKRAVR